MEKKKAIKIATATAIAASTFVAVSTSTTSKAAVTSEDQVEATQKAMKKPYDKYTKVTARN